MDYKKKFSPVAFFVVFFRLHQFILFFPHHARLTFVRAFLLSSVSITNFSTISARAVEKVLNPRKKSDNDGLKLIVDGGELSNKSEKCSTIKRDYDGINCVIYNSAECMRRLGNSKTVRHEATIRILVFWDNVERAGITNEMIILIFSTFSSLRFSFVHDGNLNLLSTLFLVLWMHSRQTTGDMKGRKRLKIPFIIISSMFHHFDHMSW